MLHLHILHKYKHSEIEINELYEAQHFIGEHPYTCKELKSYFEEEKKILIHVGFS